MKARTERGFTLLEMLVAVALFAILSVLAYGGLNQVLAAREASDHEFTRWSELEALFERVQDDLSASQAEPVRNIYGVEEAGFWGKVQAQNDDDAQLWLVRFLPDAAPRRIGYRFKDGVLSLLRWETLHPGPRERPQQTVLLRDLKGVEWRYLDAQGLWNNIWPTTPDNRSRPRAVEMRVKLDESTVVKRVLLLP